MRSTIMALLLVLPLAHAQPSPEQTVRGYFDALGRNDFRRALALTAGKAQARTAQMVGNLQQQAAANDAKVIVKVKRVDVAPPAQPDGPVEVSFDIDIVGKKWIFSKVARKLNGRAQFYVDAFLPRIVAIEGRIAE
jgi:hypothetical protein